MKTLPYRPCSRISKACTAKLVEAFTLAEVTISLGIVSMGLVGVLGLLSMGTASEKKVGSDSKAAIIARSVISDLKKDAEDGTLGNEVGLISANFASPHTVDGSSSSFQNKEELITYTDDLILIPSAGSSMSYSAGAANVNSIYLVRLFFEKIELNVGSGANEQKLTVPEVRVSIEYPATLPEEGREKHRFSTVLFPN